MSPPNLHPWDLSPKKAIEIQNKLLDLLVLSWDEREIRTVGGVDMGIKGDHACAAIVILAYPDLTPMDSVTSDIPIDFPYIPGLLAFREGPAVLAAWNKLMEIPDLILFDGQGIAHPRGIGIASHMGLWMRRPTIGVAKSRLFGHHVTPGPKRGDGSELIDEKDQDRLIGMVLRTRANVNPVYVSPGHLIDVPHAVDFVLRCCTQYRLPEPIRWAHKIAGGETLPSDIGHQPQLF